ncbi:ABC transporter substrate-binding protein [Arenibaculum pallidiluteum]|uniref:ABC transporter substrate-binding protein n=1 Tax=Arenibaculum pallidiluteum TaxID=2812559 RepID=UPI001A96DCD0|nr:extracellular solute-binding protein [Arenibaculum pallidiluteum]
MHMSKLGRGLRLAARCVAGTAVISGLALSSAAAQTKVRWLHVEQNPLVVEYWKEVAQDFEKANPGTTIEMQFLENESFKAKLPTLLQSADAPHLFYSWAGGVMRAQVDAGAVKDITKEMSGEWMDGLNPSAAKAFNHKGKFWGAPERMTRIEFFYNKALFRKAGVDAGQIRTWNDFLKAVETIKKAGITPIAVGGGEKWPVHFYWVYLAIRQGGQAAFQEATSGKGDGFAGPTFVKAGQLFKQLADLEPFQPGWQGTMWPATLGAFGDGRAAMVLSFSGTTPVLQRRNSASGQGIPDEELGTFSFPVVEGGKGLPTDTMGGINGWLVGRNAPKEAVDFLRFLTRAENQRKMGARNLYIPIAKGADAAITSPLLKASAEGLAASTYHQNFYDQDLGPAVGRVVNDTTTDLAAGHLTPEQAARAIQDAWELER